jgi:hypothetical protein
MPWAEQEYPQLCPQRLRADLDRLEEQIRNEVLVPFFLRVFPEEAEGPILDLVLCRAQTPHHYKADDLEKKKQLLEDTVRIKEQLQDMGGRVQLKVEYVRESHDDERRYRCVKVMPDNADCFADASTSASSLACHSMIGIIRGDDNEEVRSAITQHFDEIASDESVSRCASNCNSESNQSPNDATKPETCDVPVNSNPDSCRVPKEQEIPLDIPFTAGCSLKRIPVEIEQTPLGPASFGDEGQNDTSTSGDGFDRLSDLAAPLLYEGDDGNSSGVRVRLQARFHLCVSHVSRIAKVSRFFMITLFVLLGLWIVITSPLNKTTPSNDPSSENRPSDVLDCAKTLSEGVGLSENKRNGTLQWHAVNWFLGGGGIHIEVPDQCVWSSSFGIAYGLIVLRESLGVLDESWHSSVRRGENPLEYICRWKRITCNVDKTTVQRLTLNHANLSGTIPLELAHFTNLNCLQMENNNLIGTIPSEISRLTKLQDLLMHQTQLSGTIPNSLQQLTVLKQLLMDRTNLSGTMPSQICELRKQNLQFLSSNCNEKLNVSPFVRCDRAICCTSCS